MKTACPISHPAASPFVIWSYKMDDDGGEVQTVLLDFQMTHCWKPTTQRAWMIDFWLDHTLCSAGFHITFPTHIFCT